MKIQFKLLFLSFILFSTVLSAKNSNKKAISKIKIACVGNSITQGVGVKNQLKDSYPGVLGQMLGSSYEVRNFGYSARTLVNTGDFPYMKEKMYLEALDYNPDIVTIKLGTNDSKPDNWDEKEFKKDLIIMVKSFKKLKSNPKIYLVFPVPAYDHTYMISDSIILNAEIPIMKEVAKKYHLSTMDMHTALKGQRQYFPDGIHPNEQGAILIAKAMYKFLMGKDGLYNPEPFLGEKSKYNGYDRFDFTYLNKKAIVVVPKHELKGKPWIWRPAFFGNFDSVDKALLGKGYHVVYFDMTHEYGNPFAIKQGQSFYSFLVKNYNMSRKVVLEGFSRGGLYALNWAIRYPWEVSCLYLDAPVCDVTTWPGEKNVKLWNDMKKLWLYAIHEFDVNRINPINHLENLSKANIPIFGVCGDADKTVPFDKNFKVLYERYTNMGAPIQYILKKGCNHHPHSLTDPSPVVSFIMRNTK